MVSAWLMDNSNEDQRLPHHRSPDVPVSIQELNKIGVLYWKISADSFKQGAGSEGWNQLEAICEERVYKNRDEIMVSKEKLPDYDKKLEMFFKEHLHEDEEIRFCLDGSGYFDVRSSNDEWIRIAVEKDDLVVIPPGSYHRFTLDSSNYIHMVRLFKEEPQWTPVNRPAEENPFRAEYLKFLSAS